MIKQWTEERKEEEEGGEEERKGEKENGGRKKGREREREGGDIKIPMTHYEKSLVAVKITKSFLNICCMLDNVFKVLLDYLI